MLDPSRGAELFRGRRIDGDLTRYKQRLGYVPETPDLYSFLTPRAGRAVSGLDVTSALVLRRVILAFLFPLVLLP